MKTQLRMKIDGLDFDITNVDIDEKYRPFVYGDQIPGSRIIRMRAITSNQNYTKLDKWFNGVFNTNPLSTPKSYKKDVLFNTIQLRGIMPIDYEFIMEGILVTFSIDYMAGDLELFKIQQLRKAKLEKLNSLQ